MLELAIETARAAGRVAMRYFDQGVGVDIKADHTPVTRADREAEALIRDTIAARYPRHRFLGEELGGSDSLDGDVWIIDPIDGTKNFIRGQPFFATQLALYHDGAPVAAVSYAPALDELLAAERGRGSTCNGQPVHVSVVAELGDAFVLHGGLDTFEQQHRLDGLLTLGRQAMSIRGYGDFYGYHLLARGKADLMLEASIHPWDVAALRLIVTEAGGIFSDITGAHAPLLTSSLASNGLLHQAALAAMGGR